MGSMWVDPAEDPKIYPMQGQPALPFDETVMVDVDRFPDDRWGADFRAMVWIIDFMRIPSWPNDVRKGIPEPSTFSHQDLIDELKTLVGFQEKVRATALPEILAQNTEFQMYFCSALSIYPRSYPSSYLMLKVAARIGEVVMVFLKRRYHAPRPSQIYPRLTPPVPVAPHASYPSGHALIGFLLARMAGAISPSLADSAYRLAQRIARNREVAGLHFQWDSKAGEIAGNNVFEAISKPGNLPLYAKYFADAKSEWE
ncbi:MAG: hypothetical protein U1E60_10905 [Reyranellaceae bacterium]